MTYKFGNSQISFRRFLMAVLILIPPIAQAGISPKSFSATSRKNYVVIHWETVSESDIVGFYLEGSTDGSNYSPIGGLLPCLGCGDEGASYTITHKVQPGMTYSFILLSLNASGITAQTSPIWASPASSTVDAIPPDAMDTGEIASQIPRTLEGNGTANSNSQGLHNNSYSPRHQNALPDNLVALRDYPTQSPASSRSHSTPKDPESGVDPTGTNRIKGSMQHDGQEDTFLGSNTAIVLVGLSILVLALAIRKWSS